MFVIEVKYAKGWRKLRDTSPFACRERAEAYANKYLLAGWWRVVDMRKRTRLEAWREYRLGNECPECGNRDPQLIQDNGHRLIHRSYLCLDCKWQWDYDQFTGLD